MEDEEFLAVRQEEESTAQASGNAEVSQKISQEASSKKEITQETKITKEITKEIKMIMSDNPSASVNEIAHRLKVKPDFVLYRVKGMRENGEIRNDGPTKSGRWVVLK